MQQFWFVVIGMSVGGAIGALTNFLAIRMLFHPRREIRWGGRKLPFTPGLIPKRKEEIAESLGDVVARYLVTREGLADMLSKDELRRKWAAGWQRKVKEWIHSDDSVRVLLERAVGADRANRIMTAAAAWIGERSADFVRSGLDRMERQQTPLAAWLPEWTEERRRSWAEKGSEWIIQEINAGLDREEGRQMLVRLGRQFVEQSGGFMGALAGLFMDESRIADKAREALDGALASPALSRFLTGFLEERLDEIGRWTFAEAMERLGGRTQWEQSLEAVLARVSWSELVEGAASRPASAWVKGHEEAVLSSVSELAERLLDRIRDRLGDIVGALDLSRIVRDQVSKFPVERVEQIILNVSGREFRAITWLGGLLGGLIGLIQSLLLMTFFA